MDKLRELYDSLAEARREVGEDAIPFHKFADLIKTQVGTFRQKGTAEVAFRVAVKHGKVAFTARAMKGPEDDEG
jgi:DNA polymerase III sliding clamp (beta) subunit (PCNA family)